MPVRHLHRRTVGLTRACFPAVARTLSQGYIVSQIPGGSLGRRLGYKRVLTYAASGWAILTLLTVPAAGISFRALLACRFALGLVEGATYPCVYGYLQPFLLPNERSASIATMLSGSPIGTTVAFLICPPIAARAGWRGVFVFFSLCGALWVAAWHHFAPEVDEIPNFPHISTGQPGFLPGAGASGRGGSGDDFKRGGRLSAGLAPETDARVVLRRMLVTPACQVIFLCNFCLGFGQYTLLAWLPTYFNERWGISGDSLSMTMLPYLCMAIAGLSSGYVADRLIGRHTFSILRARRTINTVAFTIGGAAMLMVPEAGSAWAAVGWVCVALSGGVLTNGGFEANKFDVAGPGSVALLQGLSNTIGNLSAPIAVSLTAWVVESTDSWASVFWLVAGLYAIALVGFYAMADSRRQYG